MAVYFHIRITIRKDSIVTVHVEEFKEGEEMTKFWQNCATKCGKWKRYIIYIEWKMVLFFYWRQRHVSIDNRVSFNRNVYKVDSPVELTVETRLVFQASLVFKDLRYTIPSVKISRYFRWRYRLISSRSSALQHVRFCINIPQRRVHYTNPLV